MLWLLLFLLLPLGAVALYKALEALGMVEPHEAIAEEKRMEKRWKALQKELKEQEAQEEKEE
jgi:hypothetical protein